MFIHPLWPLFETFRNAKHKQSKVQSTNDVNEMATENRPISFKKLFVYIPNERSGNSKAQN